MENKFEYKYSVPTVEERNEINSIRNQYLPKDETILEIEALRKLDSKVKNIPMIFSLTLGICGILMFGLGLTFFLEWTAFWYWGVPISLLGIVIMILDYPIYLKIGKKLKNKYGPKIIELSNKLLNETLEKD